MFEGFLALIGGTVRYTFLLAVILIMFAGCGGASLEMFASVEEQTAAKGYIALLRENRFDELEEAMDPSLKGESLTPTLEMMSALIPKGEPTSISLVGAQKSEMEGVSELNLTFEYQFSGTWLLINVATRTRQGVQRIFGFNVLPQVASLKTQNGFSLSGKTSLHYWVVSLWALALVVSVYSLVLCLGTAMKGRRWPWIAFIAVGFGTFSLNWTTGQWWFSPFSVQLFSVSAFAPPHGPWTIAFSVPLGALLFLVKRSKLKLQDVES